MDVKVKVQKFGSFLAGMVLPNIGVFIAWGLLTAMFLDSGWFPNERLATLIPLILQYMLPLIIAYTGGEMIYGKRGACAGAVAAAGAIFGTDLPMFLGAMILGPFGAYIMKKVDQLLDGHIPVGFEMLVNNFSFGFVGVALIAFSFFLVGPIIGGLTTLAETGVKVIIHYGLMPLLAIIIEPAKVLFLNNAIDQGIFVPLGSAEILKTGGKTIYYMLVSSPAPGAGILLAYWLFGKGESKESAPSSLLIQFIGGIHEIYFPYVLMKPLMFFAVIAGGMAQIIVWVLTNAGLAGYPHPGSVLSFIVMLPKTGAINVFLGLAAGIAASCAVASLILKTDKSQKDIDVSLNSEFADMLGVPSSNHKENKNNLKKAYKTEEIQTIVFACDAGVGSSAMGASVLKKKIQDAGLNLEVIHCPVDRVPKDTKVILTQENLKERAQLAAPNAVVRTVQNFLGDPQFDKTVNDLLNGEISE